MRREMQRVRKGCAAFFVVAALSTACAACGAIESESMAVGTEMLEAASESLPGTEMAEVLGTEFTEMPDTETVEIPDTELPESEMAETDWREEHIKVRGIYVTGPIAGNAVMGDLIRLVDETELNTMVIDIKNDDGYITFKMQLEQAEALGACIRYIPDMEGLMAELKEHGIYTIARIVCFKDPLLAADPGLALRKPDGSPVTDANGLAFVNPYKEEVWEYLVDVAEKAAEQGFDEIQFDYVRFPVGQAADGADYGVDITEYPKEQAITDFLQYAQERLRRKNIVVGADVFGTIIGSKTDIERVGQDYQVIGGMLDVLSPMVYPSHYGPGVFGLEVPDAHPYETVLSALEGSARELEGVPEEKRAVVRPWLQGFTASWVSGHIPYGGEEIRAQIQAVYDAGYDEWILWNASNRYTADGLEAEEGL